MSAEPAGDHPADALALFGGALIVGLVGSGMARRVGHPFDLEWMEGGMLAHAWRLAEGLPIYPQPGPDWIPYVYPPGYSAVLAALPFELDYPLGRLVSIAGVALAAAAIVRLARGSLAAGLVGAAAFVGCWRASGAFYDLVRPDGLAIGLLAWSVALAADRRRGTDVASGLLLAAAFAVKHSCAAFGVPLALGLWLRDGWRRGLAFGLASAVPGGLFTLYLQARTGGRFVTYLLEVPASHHAASDGQRVLPGTPGELGDWLLPAVFGGAAWLVATLPAAALKVPRAVLLALPALGAVAGAAFLLALDPPRGVGVPTGPVLAATGACIGAGLGAGVVHALAAVVARHADGRWWLAFGVGGTALVVAGLMRGHNGGFLNVLMPAHWAICAGLALAVADARARWPGLPAVAGTSALLAVQIGVILAKLDVTGILPTREDAVAGWAIVDRLRACPEGEVLSPHAPWLAVQAGRAPGPHLIAIWDINHKGGPLQGAMKALSAAAAERRWVCIVSGKRLGDPQSIGFLGDAYEVAESFQQPNGKAMMPQTGWRVRPAYLLVPKAPEPEE